VPFHSILFEATETSTDLDDRKPPEFFADLHLDQIVSSITAGRDEYNLRPFFYVPLRRVSSVRYRQDIFRDFENQALLVHIQSFAQRMRATRESLAQAEKLSYKYQKQSWFLSAADLYCTTVKRLTRDMTIAGPSSRGLSEFCAYLKDYVNSGKFTQLLAETEKLRADLSRIRYCLCIQGSRITVGRYEPQPDYGEEVLHTFETFKQTAAKDYQFDFSTWPEMNHVETAILDRVALLFPKTFASLEDYFDRHRGFVDHTIKTFDREVQFYVACIEHMDLYKKVGLHFCHPIVTDQSKEVCGRDVYDLALANNSLSTKKAVITNDFYLKDPERIFVVSGPNQGGKTTFARMFGQIHYLASIGYPVPGKGARLFLFDNLFTHFEKEEDLRNLSGKLEDDLLRIHQILERATSDSILIMNESFASTTLADALFLSKQIMKQIIQSDMLCVSVTFLDELSSLGETTVSMVSTVRPEDSTQRTFKVIRKAADGLAYAATLADKYQLTYESVKRRIQP
jgi:DNA mismatch repair protein MutS